MPRHDYAALGERGIQELLDAEHAVVWPEVEAKLADRQWPTLPVPIQPHHLTTARHRLLDQGIIANVTQATRGGRPVPVIVPVEQRLRKRAITDAAARKRLLQTRFLTWASGSTQSGAGVIGPAGEHVVHTALCAAGPSGYRLLNPGTGVVTAMLGAPIPGGSLDNGAFLTTIDQHTLTPSGQYVVPVEVKNVRSWIHTGAAELHQLLDKAARLQLAHPTYRFLPVLVCRRLLYPLGQVAENLGFYVIQTKRQYVPPALDAQQLAEVTAELGYDLEPYATDPPPALVRHFTHTLQSVAERTADRWAVSAEHLGDYFHTLRDPRLRTADRSAITREMLEVAEHVHEQTPRKRRMVTEIGDDIPF